MGKIAERIYGCEPWRITEDAWQPERNRVGESIFSLSNEHMGVRGYAEEGADADCLLGSYFGGVYEWGDEAHGGYKGVVRRTHFMVCAADFLRVRLFQGARRIRLDGSARGYFRSLDLRCGLLERRYDTPLPDGSGTLSLRFRRVLGMDDPRFAAQEIALCADVDTTLRVELAIDGSVKHQMTGRCLWRQTDAAADADRFGLRLETATTAQTVEYLCGVSCDGQAERSALLGDRLVGIALTIALKAGQTCTVSRRICNTVSPDGALDLGKLDDVPPLDALLERSRAHWDAFWSRCDVAIEGDALNQQGIRFCLFQLHQTYRGLDGRHNIGAKGLTGEAYNGHAFWDSETYCLPFYLLSDRRAAKSLLMYRYNTLEQAKKRAKELDCEGACYPIATMNGHEACNLWQHASLQMQPSTAVAYAIMQYALFTGDDAFLFHEGIEMLVEISRYVVSRGGWNADHTGFGFWGVMGPDEFHMMVNNNFYTNYMGARTLLDTLDVLSRMENPDALTTPKERAQWREIAGHMIVSRREDGVIEQHDGYFTLPYLDIHSIPVSDFPLYEHWSYDRIYRTSMIKQPDVLMAMFLHPEDFTRETLRANYDYYEPRCIHESSLSPSVHAILAQRLGRGETAADFFSFATRMDLDNYNRNTGDGLHTTSIAAAWVTIVYGFGGLTTRGQTVCLAPHLPKGWRRYSFRFSAGESVVCARVDQSGCSLSLVSGPKTRVKVNGEWVEVTA